MTNLSYQTIFIRAAIFSLTLITISCTTPPEKNPSICVYENVCVTFNVDQENENQQQSERRNIRQIQNLLNAERYEEAQEKLDELSDQASVRRLQAELKAKEELINAQSILRRAKRPETSFDEKLRLYIETEKELNSIIKTHTSTELARQLKNGENIEDINLYDVKGRKEAILAFQEAYNKIQEGRSLRFSLEYRVVFYEESIELLDGLIEKYPTSEVVEKLRIGESVEDIRISDIEQELDELRVQVSFNKVNASLRKARQPWISLLHKIRLYEGVLSELGDLVAEFGGTELGRNLSRDERVEGVQISEVEDELETLQDDKVVLERNVRDFRGQRVQVLKVLSSDVKSVAFSPDGTQIASGSWQEIRLWDAATGQYIRSLTGHSEWVGSLSYSPDGTKLVSGSDDDTIRLWDVATGRQIRTLTGHSDDVTSVVFSPDGSQVASGSHDDTIRLWNAVTGQHTRTLAGHRNGVLSVSYSPDGTQLASGSDDDTIRLWDVATGRSTRTLTGHNDNILSVSYSPDGTQLVSGSQDTTIRLWDVESEQLIRTITGRLGDVKFVSYSPDGTQVVSGICGKRGTDDTCTAGEIRFWDVTTGRYIRTLTGHSDWVLSVSFSRDGTQLVSGSTRWNSDTQRFEGEIYLWK